MLWIILVIAIVLILVIWYITTRNKFVTLENTCEESFSGIDIYLKKRYDLIPNLVETVKGYTKHEQETLEKVISARNAAMTATGNEKVEAENALSGTLKSLFALSEAYPDLKADTHFLELQKQLKEIETDLSQARKYYNGTAKAFNIYLQRFPSNLVGNGMKLTAKKYFEAGSEERANVKVQF